MLKMRSAAIITVCQILFSYEALGSTVFIADFGMSKMIELSTKPPYCVVQLDRGKIRDMLLTSDPRRVRQMSDDSIAKLEKVCKNNQVQSPHQGGFIYPGTKWCGPGNIANNYSDLGYHVKEDMCCREHDNCPKSLSNGKCIQRICNNSPFTRSHCDCDAAFRRCLQNVNTETANTIGAIFFNVVQVICFKERTPCTQWQSTFEGNNSISSVYSESFEEQCDYRFTKSQRYIASEVRSFNLMNKKEFFINILLRKFRLL
ncbi:uncharacterized protein LOC108910181 [Anoplophora glabripennis]|uniref:uncharacterized protein LOC108910181 n=1 Tax=Anoplophora glabripennis TaxID=217634 RepID=UPI000874DED6|nr:uncharacterized protein LOC108910181 [Anoplophora glabripennis]